ncbi:MAG: DUF512 domain-containing protein [Oscillospiraceae bacterium]|nr:DUF512 domain-containing protein [Oscillospiraceae bacterium]
MAVRIDTVEKDSPAARRGIVAGDTLLALDGHAIDDVLDYRFYLQNGVVDASFRTQAGKARILRFHKVAHADIGLKFETYLMDEQRTCRNRCIFCFIDQLPRGLRKSLYFKDDDARLSFLFGNYITLTNLSEREAARICEMHISPVNVSVHTMNPALRYQMMGNEQAGESLRYLRHFAEAGIKINAQLVLCPGLNDGDALRESLEKLRELGECVQSIAAVPVGLTAHRAGLTSLSPYTKESAAAVLEIIDAFNATLPDPIAYAADEFYLKAQISIPPLAHYGDLHQLENGVGMWALFRDEAADFAGKGDQPCTVVTGTLAYPLIFEICARVNPNARVIAVPNLLLGGEVTVAGLLSGGDILSALREKELGARVLFPASCLNRDGVFLDDETPEALSAALGVPFVPVPCDGCALCEALAEA